MLQSKNLAAQIEVAHFQFTISLLFIDLLFKKEKSIEIADV